MGMVDVACPACHTSPMDVFYEQEQVPAHSVLLMSSREEALSYPRGDIRLGFCRTCGFIANLAFDVALNEYSQMCEESQGFSPYFRNWLRGLAEEFVERYDVRGKEVIEIGCGKGEFLALVCAIGENRGVGIDPAYVPGRLETECPDRLRFINDLYSEAHGELAGDVVICRHTLEHIGPVADFVGIVQRSLADRHDVVVFFELPDTLRVLRDVAFWDVYYEHCSYFTPGSLTRLFRRERFDPISLRLGFDDQYVLLDARPGRGQGAPLDLEEDLAETTGLVEHFRSQLPDRVRYLQSLVDGARRRGRRTVLWGGGSKAVAFLTTLAIEDAIEYVVDINPHKQGKFIAGAGQEVVAPRFLVEYRPDVVIAMNSIYRDEIEQQLDRMGLAPELLAI